MLPEKISGTIVRLPTGELGFMRSGLKLKQDEEGNPKPVPIDIITDEYTCQQAIDPQTRRPIVCLVNPFELTEVGTKNDWEDNFPDGNGTYIPHAGQR